MDTQTSGERDRNLASIDEMGTLLARLLARHGVAILDSRRRLLGLLRDHAPEQTRAIRLLLTAYDEGVPERIAAEGAALPPMKIDREAALLVSDHGLQPDLARWAVDVWNLGLSKKPEAAAPTASGPAAAAAAAAPSAPIAVPLPTTPRTDDLTWGSEVVQAPAAVPLAPSVATPDAAPLAPSVTPAAAAPSASAAAPPAPQRPWVRYVTIAAAVIVGLSGLTKLANFGGEDAPPPPAAPAPAPSPAAPAPAPRAADPPRAAPEPPAKRHVVASRSDDAGDWPVFSGAAHPDGVATAWQFQFNVDVGGGRLFAYNVHVSLDRDLRGGYGSVRALDLRHDVAEMVSSTPNLPVSRELNSSGKAYFTRIMTTSWIKNPSNAPTICVVFSSGARPQSFEPNGGVFCAFELIGSACSKVVLGCGRVE